MSPEEFKEARRKLGLTTAQMAEALGLSDGRVVRRWEKGDRQVSGPVQLLIKIWLDPRCPNWAKPATRRQ